MNIDVFYAVLFGLLGSTTLILFKKANDKKFSSWVYTFWWSGLTTLFILPFAILNFEIPSWDVGLLHLFLASLFWMLTSVFTITAFKYTEASVVLLIGRLSNVGIFLLGWILLGDDMSVIKILGLVLILLGSASVVFEKGKLRIEKRLVYSFIPVLFIIAATFSEKQGVGHLNFLMFAFLEQGLQMIMSFLVIRNKGEIKELFIEKKSLIIPGTLAFAIAYSGFLFLLKNNQISVITLSYETMVFLGSMVLGIIYLKESAQLWQKIVGTILAITGVFLLAF